MIHFGLTEYLLLGVLVDRAFLAPVPETANLLNSEFLENSLHSIIDQNEVKQDRRPFGNDKTYISLLFNDFVISKYRNEIVQKNYVKKQVKRENNRNEYTYKTQEVPKQTYEIHINNDELKSRSAEKQEDVDTPTPFTSVPFTAVVTITRDNVREPEETSFEETRDPPDAFSPCFDKKYSRREIPGNPEFSTKSKDTLQKHEITGPLDLLQLLRRRTTKTHDAPLKGTNSAEESEPRDHTEECMPSPIIEFENENPESQTNETSQRQQFDDDDEESEGSLGSITSLLPLVLPVLQDLSDPNSDTDLGGVVTAAIPLLGGLLGNEGGGILDMFGSILTRILGGANGEGSDIIGFITPLVGPFLRATGPFLATVGAPFFSAFLNIIRSPDALSSIVKAIGEALSQVDANGNSPILDTAVDIAVSVFKDLRPGLPGGLDVAAIVEAVTAGTITGTFAASDASIGYGGSPPPYGSYGPYGTGPVPAGSVNILRISPEIVSPQRKTNSYLRKNSLKKERLSSFTPISGSANNAKHHRNSVRTTQKPYFEETSAIFPSTLPSLPDFGQYHIPGPVPAGSNTGGSSYSTYGNSGVPAYGVNPVGLIISSLKDVFGAGIQVVSSLINAVFGISGASSVDKPQGYGYGPPPYAGSTRAP